MKRQQNKSGQMLKAVRIISDTSWVVITAQKVFNFFFQQKH